MAAGPLPKAIRLLKRLIEMGEPIGVQQLAGDVDLRLSTTHRLLQVLVTAELASYDPGTRLYGVGSEFVRLANVTLNGDTSIGRIRPIVRRLADQLGETCAFNLFEPRTGTMIVAIVERGPHALGYDLEIGRRDGIYAGASGKAILAALPDDELATYLSRAPLLPLTSATVVDASELRRQVHAIRPSMVAFSRGERIPGAVGVAAAVFGPSGRVVGSLLVTIPEFRHTPAAARAAALVHAGARELNGLLDREPAAILAEIRKSA
jgi:DNA-binding IclR family transcriptional regulator